MADIKKYNDAIQRMPKPWNHCTPYAVARGIAEQHGVDPDQAFRFAWYGMKPDPPTANIYQVFSRMAMVRIVPDVPEEVMRMFQKNLQGILYPDD